MTGELPILNFVQTTDTLKKHKQQIYVNQTKIRLASEITGNGIVIADVVTILDKKKMMTVVIKIQLGYARELYQRKL